MAITITQNPDIFTPVYNEINFVVSSTNTAQSNFKYVADVYITGVTGFVRLKQQAHPDLGFARFDVARVIESYVNSDIGDSTFGWQRNSNSFKSYQVKFGEEYGPSSGVIVYPDLTLSTTRYAFNGVFDFKDNQAFEDAPYVLVNGAQKRFLTDAPSSGVINLGENAWLHMMTNTSGTIDKMTVSVYTGGPGVTYDITNTFSSLSVEADRFLRFPAGPNNINQIPSLGTIINASTLRYTMQTFNTSGSATSELYQFTMDTRCSIHTNYRIHFLNKLGGFDSFTFLRADRKAEDIARSRYKKVLGSIKAGGFFNYAKSDRQKVDYNTVITEKITVNSDWITDDESTWLEQLISSPEVYYEETAGDLWAINILNASFEEKKSLTDVNFNLVLEFEYTYNRYRQRQ